MHWKNVSDFSLVLTTPQCKIKKIVLFILVQWYDISFGGKGIIQIHTATQSLHNILNAHKVCSVRKSYFFGITETCRWNNYIYFLKCSAQSSNASLGNLMTWYKCCITDIETNTVWCNENGFIITRLPFISKTCFFVLYIYSNSYISRIILLIVNKNTDFLCMLYKQTERFENILRGLLPEC